MPDQYGRGLSCSWQALGVLTTFFAISSLAPINLEGQAQTWRLPHTAWGDPISRELELRQPDTIGAAQGARGENRSDRKGS